MAIESASSAWDPGDEASWHKAVATLELTATDEWNAKFLAELSACFRRGKVDAGLFGALSRKLLGGK